MMTVKGFPEQTDRAFEVAHEVALPPYWFVQLT